MSFLLDTNVVSEWTKPQPDRHVVSWLDAADEDQLFLSVASFAEIRLGIENMPKGRRRERLRAWLDDDLAVRFENRTIAIDRVIAETWGVIVNRAKRVGATVGSMDAFFAATAEVRGLTLVTRNVRDFRTLGIAIFDPWSAQADT